MTFYEFSVAQILQNIVEPYGYGERAFWEVMQHPDMQRVDPETGQLAWASARVALLLPEIHYYDRLDLLPRLIDMPFLETFEELDDIPLRFLDQMLAYSSIDAGPEDEYRVLTHPSLQNGLTDEEPFVPLLAYLEGRDPGLAARIAVLPWIEDGIDESEYLAARRLQGLALQSLPVTQALIEKPWVWDGLDWAERSVMFYLESLSRDTWLSGSTVRENFEADVLNIVGMPFLETVGPLDAAALRTLDNFLSSLDIRPAQILNHPRLRDGITDDLAIAIVASDTLIYNPDKTIDEILLLFDQFSEPGWATVEQRIPTFPLAGEVFLTVVRTDEYPRYMNTLDDTILRHEAFMGVPYPNKYVILFVADIGGGGYAADMNARRLVIDIGYAETGDNSVLGVIGHEVGHSYWGGVAAWMTEGGAVFLQRIGEGLRNSEFNFRIGEETCPASEGHAGQQFHNLTELQFGRASVDVHACDYIMGSGIFFDLYNALGREVFQQGFRELHLNRGAERFYGLPIAKRPPRITDEVWYDGVKHEECSLVKGKGYSWCHMKAAFVAGQEPDIAAKADSILKLWFTARPDTADS